MRLGRVKLLIREVKRKKLNSVRLMLLTKKSMKTLNKQMKMILFWLKQLKMGKLDYSLFSLCSSIGSKDIKCYAMPQVPIEKDLPHCRICYSTESELGDEVDPLITPCHCKGTMKYIHLECLRRWINAKV
jgi:hypothetical protein